jgi:septum formation protein
VVTVHFRAFGPSVAHALAASGEGRASCGGYESENRGGQLIARIEGSHYAVLGLPVLKVLEALRRVAPELDGLL